MTCHTRVGVTLFLQLQFAQILVVHLGPDNEAEVRDGCETWRQRHALKDSRVASQRDLKPVIDMQGRQQREHIAAISGRDPAVEKEARYMASSS